MAAPANGMLSVALLGYLGIKQMEAVGKPLRWEVRGRRSGPGESSSSHG